MQEKNKEVSKKLLLILVIFSFVLATSSTFFLLSQNGTVKEVSTSGVGQVNFGVEKANLEEAPVEGMATATLNVEKSNKGGGVNE